jgi:thiol:disulfide interchange protein
MMLPLLAALVALAATPQVDLGGGKPAKREVKVVAVRPEKTDVKPGEVFKVAFDLEIPAGWHIYPTVPTTTGTPTMVVIEGVEVAGPYVEPKPKTHPKTADVDAYDYHEGAITITAPLRVKADVKPGPFEAKGILDYQICNPTTCIPARTAVAFKLAVQEGAAAAPAPAQPPAPAPAPAKEEKSFFVMLGVAFLGGLILNVMPCVLPVLMNKLGSLVKQAELTPGARRAAALSFTAGILACLNAFGLGVIILGLLGRRVGWGFQFQQPGFVIGLATLIFVFALSLLGVFNVPSLATGAATEASRKKGLAKHFFTGFYMTLVATPCSAPGLGSSIGYAFTLPPAYILLFFSVVGLGLAFPFLLVGFVPRLLRFLPRPGAWMEVFERVSGFLLMAVVVWLIDTLGSLTGPRGVTGALAFLTAVALGCWILGRWGSEIAERRSRILSLVAAVVLAVVAGRFFLVTERYVPPAVAGGIQLENLDFSKHIPWQPFSEESVAAVRAARKPGFIDFTADW